VVVPQTRNLLLNAEQPSVDHPAESLASTVALFREELAQQLVRL
jgi:hypothetical protein